MSADSSALKFDKDMPQDFDLNVTNYLLFFEDLLLMVQYFSKL